MSGDKPIQRQSHAPKGLPAQGTAPAGERGRSIAPAFQTETLGKDVFGAPSMAVPGLSYHDLYEARDWKPGSSGISGSKVNEKITQAYSDIDRAMTAYLGEPKRMNWTTFGKYASRGAGEQILKLEALERAMRLDPGAASSLVADAARDPKASFAQAKALFNGKASPKKFIENARKLRQALVYGNTGIMVDIGPAYHAFLQAEKQGKDGMTALRAAGYGAAPKDPQGFVMNAFRRYQTAKKMSDEIEVRCKALGIADPNKVQSDPLTDALKLSKEKWGDKLSPREEVLRLICDRDETLLEANLYLGMQEQYCTLQTPQVFDDKDIETIIGDLSKYMVAVDPTGVIPLLPDGGNWANFFERMGLREARSDDERERGTPDHPPIQLFADGKNFVLVPSGKDGTIFSYFADAHVNRKRVREGDKFREVPDMPLIGGEPKPLPRLYTRNPLNRDR